MNTKDKIIDIAIRLFSEYSITEVTFSKIASELGIQKAAVYYYFKNKREITTAIVDYAHEHIVFEAPTLLLEQYRNKEVAKFCMKKLMENCRSVEEALKALVIENVIPPCPSHQIAWAYAFNHCALCIQSVLLHRDIADSLDYRIKSSAILVGAIESGAYLK